MIPKVVHYCWFGGKPLPKDYERYMTSWRKFLPGYEIKRWDESNYNVNCIPFSEEAYRIGKYAYVSDYARLKILYEEGGIYLDTDVELIKSLDDIIALGAYMGFEKNSNSEKGEVLGVNPGLGFAVEAGNPIIREALDFYETHHFIYPDGHMEQITIVTIVTNILKRHGLSRSDIPTTINGITIYPWDYFCPMEALSNKIAVTENTHSIHHYSASWMSWTDKLKMLRGYYIHKMKAILGIKKH